MQGDAGLGQRRLQLPVLRLQPGVIKNGTRRQRGVDDGVGVDPAVMNGPAKQDVGEAPCL